MQNKLGKQFYFCFYPPGGMLFSVWRRRRRYCMIISCGWFGKAIFLITITYLAS